MRLSLLTLFALASAERLRGASSVKDGVTDGALASEEPDDARRELAGLVDEEESEHGRRLATCTNLAETAGVPRSKDISGQIKKGWQIWSQAEMQPLMNLMTKDKEYAMTFRAWSTCPDDVVLGFVGGGGWMKMVVDAGSNNVWIEEIDDCKSVTDGRFMVTSSQTAWEYTPPNQGSGSSDRRRLATGWPTCAVSIRNLKVYENSCYSAPPPAPTPSPTQAPTTSTTTTLPITPMTYFTWLFAGVIQPLLPHISKEETPIQIRHTSIIDAINWNCAAVYSATYKDALTKVRPTLVAPTYLHETDVRARCMLAANDHFTRIFLTDGRAEIRAQCANFRVTLNAEDDATIQTACPNLNAANQRFGDPNAFYQASRDEACLAGVAAAASWDYKIVGPIIAEKVMGYGAVDGWNALGDVGRDGTPCTANCRHFRDTTNYQPKDPNTTPNTWEPLLEDRGDGFFYRQEHVTPHIGAKASFRVIPETERAARVAPAPNYDYAVENELVKARLRSLTDATKMQVEFHDSKLDILLYCFTALLQSGAFPSLEPALAFLVGYTAGEHDALIIAWKEKVRYDLVRPTTKIQETDPTEDISCYGGPDYRDTRTIKAQDFQPYKRVMPHSEYPSGSACLCRGVRDYVDAFLTAKGRPTTPPSGSPPFITVPYAAGSSVQEPGYTPASPLALQYNDMTELAAACSASRLDGGMHFTASVPAAEALCDGIGTAGFAYANDLIGGQWDGPPLPAPTAMPLPAPTSAPTRDCDALFAGPYAVANNNQISSSVEVYDTYSLAFTMALDSSFAFTGSWQSVLHFGTGGWFRLPGFWFQPGILKLHVMSRNGPASASQWGLSTLSKDQYGNAFVPGNTYYIKIIVDNTHMTAYVDDVMAGQASRTNWDPLAGNVPLYAGLTQGASVTGAAGVTVSDICLTQPN